MEEGIRHAVAALNAPASCASCMSRRSFLQQSALIAAIGVVAASCGDTGISDPTSPKQVKVSDFPGLATVGQLVIIDDQRSAKRTGDTTFAAFSRSCTHEHSAVNVSGNVFVCPNHGARFDNNGHVTLGPANRDLKVLITAYDAATDTLTIG